MLERTEQELSLWKSQMKGYEKSKRTKKPFGSDIPTSHHVTHKDIKTKEIQFNPILQTYASPQDELRRESKDDYNRAKSLMTHMKQTQKYQRSYDIVNLYSNDENLKEGQNNKKQGPIRNAYNIINNQKLPQIYFQNRDIKIPIEREKVLINHNPKEYNIVTGIFYKNNEEKVKQKEQKQKQTSQQKYWKTHNYDPVYGHFYDHEKQEHFQQERKIKEKDHGKNFANRLPPSYNIPQEMQTYDQKRLNQKKRYQLKYIIEDEYNHRNLEHQIKQQKTIQSKLHQGRIQVERSKQFDIITTKPYEPSRIDYIFNRSSNIQPVSSIQSSLHLQSGSTFGKNNNEIGKIKTGGFS